MTDFEDRLKDKLIEHGLSGGRLLLGVSGGPDSVALLCALATLRETLGLNLTTAHLNHGLRGAAAEADAVWVSGLCGRLDVPLVSATCDVAATAKQQGIGIEEASRQVRYEFLCSTAAERGCSHVLVAHTADDQAETILHHILRGTGISGLRGMSETRDLGGEIVLFRPLLETSRHDLHEYLRLRQQAARIDASNSDPAFTRSRLRTRLLPLIQNEFNPQVVEALLRLGRQAGELSAALDELTAQTFRDALVDANPSVCRLDCDALTGLPRHFVRECLKEVWTRQGWPLQRMGFREWQRLAELVATGGTAALPHGVNATRRGKLLVLHHAK